MESYRVLVLPTAGREMERLGRKDLRRIIARIRALSVNPRPAGCKKLVGEQARYRLRHGVYRILYLINDQAREVTVFQVGHRKDVY